MTRTAAVLAMLVTGCASSPPIEHITVDSSSSTIRRHVIVAQPGTAPPSHVVLQKVSARSCQEMAWDAAATEDDAIAQLQIKAARLEGNLLVDVACEPRQAATLSPSCWNSIVCHGTAAKTR